MPPKKNTTSTTTTTTENTKKQSKKQSRVDNDNDDAVMAVAAASESAALPTTTTTKKPIVAKKSSAVQTSKKSQSSTTSSSTTAPKVPTTKTLLKTTTRGNNNNNNNPIPRHLVPSTPSSKSRSSNGGDSHLMSQMLSSLSEEAFANLQRLHLVIDLDSTFVSTRTDESSYHRAVKLLKTSPVGEEVLTKRVYLFSIGGTRMWTILRPGALEFIEFASFYFKTISVWSAGQKDYVDQIVSFLFPAHIPRPSIVFNWDDCAQEVTTFSSHDDDDDDVGGGGGESEKSNGDATSSRKAASPSNQEFISFTKPLVDIIPHAPKGDTLEHMLILDDRSDIAEKNIENLVQIPAYEPAISFNALTSPDTALDKFVEWLMKPEVINAKDIRKVEKSKIFFTPRKIHH